MKILHLLDHSLPFISGYTVRSHAIARHQLAQGHQVACITGVRQPQSHNEKFSADGIDYHRTHAHRSRLPAPLRELQDMRSIKRALKRAVRSLEPDIIHAHSPYLCGLPALQVGRARRIPVVYEIRGFWEDAAVTHGRTNEGSARWRISRMLETRLCKKADAVITICASLQQELIERGIEADKITVAANGVDPEEFSGIRKHANRGILSEYKIDNHRLIGFAGSFYAYEGLDILIKAAPEIFARHKDTVIILVGDGPEEMQLRWQVEEAGLSDRIIFSGRVAREKALRLHALFDIAVYPRKKTRLNELVTPLKPLESMALRVSVVASDVGGHRELINDTVTGRLCKPDCPKALSGAIIGALDMYDESLSLSKKACSWVFQQRSWDKTLSAVIPLYRSLLS